MKMKDNFKNIDENKLRMVIEIKEAYNSGEISLEEGKRLLKEKVKILKPYEIALVEQELKEIENDECKKENIQDMLLLFEDIMDTSRPDLNLEHPIMKYYMENDELKKILLEIEDLLQYPVIKNQWLDIYERLIQFKKHLSRKQNQLYSVLEKKGFDRPTTTMWLLDDFVRDEISNAYKLLKDDKENEFIDMQGTLVHDLRDLMSKEESVLYPTSLAMINDEEFEEMKTGDLEIGFSWITTDKENRQNPTVNKNFNDDLMQLLNKYGYGNTENKLDVATGRLSLEQINLIYKHMPVDLSFVDENELVCFYTDTKHRVFPRSKNVIGRNVKNCHPRSSVHIVEEIIEKFRSGEQDSVDFWINKENIFIYIYYVAVRDENGKFRGILEMMQDCTHIRSLVGSRTLLTWSENNNDQLLNDDILENNKECEVKTDIDNIDSNTKLLDLMRAYPSLKNRMIEISPKFKILETPLARVMLPKATIKKVADRIGMDEDKLIANIQKIIKEEK